MTSFISARSLFVLVLVSGCFTLPITENLRWETSSPFASDVTTDKLFDERMMLEDATLSSTSVGIKQSSDEFMGLESFSSTDRVMSEDATRESRMLNDMATDKSFTFTPTTERSFRQQREMEDFSVATVEPTTEHVESIPREPEIESGDNAESSQSKRAFDDSVFTTSASVGELRSFEGQFTTITPKTEMQLDFTTSFMPSFISTSSAVAPELYTRDPLTTQKYTGLLADKDDQEVQTENDEEHKKAHEKHQHNEEEKETTDEKPKKHHEKHEEEGLDVEEHKHDEEEKEKIEKPKKPPGKPESESEEHKDEHDHDHHEKPKKPPGKPESESEEHKDEHHHDHHEKPKKPPGKPKKLHEKHESESGEHKDEHDRDHDEEPKKPHEQNEWEAEKPKKHHEKHESEEHKDLHDHDNDEEHKKHHEKNEWEVEKHEPEWQGEKKDDEKAKHDDEKKWSDKHGKEETDLDEHKQEGGKQVEEGREPEKDVETDEHKYLTKERPSTSHKSKVNDEDDDIQYPKAVYDQDAWNKIPQIPSDFAILDETTDVVTVVNKVHSSKSLQSHTEESKLNQGEESPRAE